MEGEAKQGIRKGNITWSMIILSYRFLFYILPFLSHPMLSHPIVSGTDLTILYIPNLDSLRYSWW